jgi:hypothetical protein
MVYSMLGHQRSRGASKDCELADENPVNPKTWNRYAYALNNLNWIMVPAGTEALGNHWDSLDRARDRSLDKVDWASQNDTVRNPAERMKNKGLEKASWEETFPSHH